MTNKDLIKKGEVISVHGIKTLFLPCEEPEHKPKKRRTSRGKISKFFKNSG